MTHSTHTAGERRAHGISEGLVRISAGLEDTDDLLADVLQALEAAGGRRAPALAALAAH
jgi:methionine-gamma-lyase